MASAQDRDPVARAAALFEEGFNCAEAVAAAFAERHGASPETALRAACALGAGVSRTGQTCGAVSGALIAIGLAHGRREARDAPAKERTYAAGAAFCARFRSLHGSLACPELLGFDTTTPEGWRAAGEAGLFRTRCPDLVRSAAAIVAELG
jgi:C_GCAxxG_C_C family probable redox protein